MTLGQNIQNARRAQGLSQEALAEKIGVSRLCGFRHRVADALASEIREAIIAGGDEPDDDDVSSIIDNAVEIDDTADDAGK